MSESIPKQMPDEAKRNRHLNYIKEHWTALTQFAREGFQESGRGAVVIISAGMNPSHAGTQAKYLTIADIRLIGDPTIASQVEKYNPQTQIVFGILEPDGSQSSYVLEAGISSL
jgi:hypothetical protein